MSDQDTAVRIERFFPDHAYGLTGEQVRLRMESGLFNKTQKSITRSTGRILFDNIFTFFNALLLGIFIALLAVKSYNNLFFIGVMLANLLLGIVQELRSKYTVEKLSLLHAPSARALREGTEQEISCDQIVLDDVLVLSLGQQIPTDCVLLSGMIETDESSLTGESKPQLKKPGDELLSGSVVLSGSCYARVERVGKDCYAHQLASEARKYKRPHSELMHSLRLIIRFTALLVLPMGALMFWRTYAHVGHLIKSAVEQAAASMLGMIPAGLMLLTSVSLAVGVITLARRQTLVQQQHCIETLSRVDMLCLDKTGTLTTGNMQVKDICYANDGDRALIDELLNDMVQTMPPVNPTARTLHGAFHAPPKRKALGLTDFSSLRRYSAAAFSDRTLYIGAPETLCKDLPAHLQTQAKEAVQNGCRVLLFAQGPASETPPLPDEIELAPLCLLLLLDEIREETGDALRFFREEGVAIKLISGDNPATVAHIARRLQIPGHDRYIDASTLDDEALMRAANEYVIFGRVSPHQKKLLICALKSAGHTVAMTGDGVNDLLALREADCSIALNGGSDSAKQISHMVLLTDDFSALPHIVMEGRRVINNVTRTASLFLVKTTYSFLLTVGSVLIGLAYPFQPIQLSLISTITVGMPAFLLSLEPNRTRIQGRFIESVFAKAIPGGLVVTLYALIAGVIGRYAGLPYSEINTLCVFLTATACLLVLLRVSQPLRKYRAIVYGSMITLFFIIALTLRGFLALILPPSGTVVIMYCVMAAACYPLLLALEGVGKRIVGINKTTK